MFHVSLLKTHLAGGTAGTRPEPIEVDGALEYHVERIVRHRYHGQRRQYLVRWEGYDASEDTWLRADELEHARERLEAYQRGAGLSSPQGS